MASPKHESGLGHQRDCLRPELPGNARLVLELALRGRFEFYISPFILGEVGGVLIRKFGWDKERTAQAIRVIENAATVI